MLHIAKIGLVSALVAACASSNAPGPKGDSDGGADGGAGGKVVLRSCITTIAHRPADPSIEVLVAGEWNWDQPMALTDPDGDGERTIDLDLAAGVHAYKLVMRYADGGEDWIIDPGASYRKYDAGIENSAVRVGDCTVPLIEIDEHSVADGRALTRARVLAGSAGSAIPRSGMTITLRSGTSEQPVPDSAVSFDGHELTITLDDVATGKHTLVIHATDSDGQASLPVRVPFWVEDQPFDWRGALIYMAMVDRFANGDPQNDPDPALGAIASADFHGGDLAGITAAIEDGTFDELGVTALWLSPVVTNTARVHYDGDYGITGYHGYWPTKARAVDPRLGGDEALDQLVAAAHARGIRVLMDFVINHVHEDHEYVADHPEWFRSGCQCGTDGCGWTERRLDCLFRPYLPDVNWQHPEVGEQFIADALWWLERFDLDGLRVDAVKHVEDAAVFNLASRINEELERGGTEYFLLGETAMGWAGHDLAANQSEYDTISRYIGERGLTGQFDFVLYHATAYRVWADDEYGMPHLDFWTRASLDAYPEDAIMTPFVGSHDSERLISLATYGSGDPIVHNKWPDQPLPQPPDSGEAYDRAGLALTWLMTVPGAPLLYYGDEYGEHGGGDPDNRHMWRKPGARSTDQAALHQRVARAGRARKELAPLRLGDYQPLEVSENVLSFARTTGDDAVVVAINRSSEPSTVVVDVTGVPLPSTVIDWLDSSAEPISATDGQLTVNLAPRSAAIFATPPEQP